MKFKFVQRKNPTLYQGMVITKYKVGIYFDKIVKLFTSEPPGLFQPILTKHSWVYAILVC